MIRVEEKLGLHASDTCQIALTDVRIHKSLMLGKEGEGLKIALANLEGGRIGIAAQAVGLTCGARRSNSLCQRAYYFWKTNF